MSRRLVSSPSAEPEVRQRGMVYQKNRKQSDAWVPTERAYGRFRIDVPGEAGQKELRPPLGFCRDRMAAMLKLQKIMEKAGVLDIGKIQERIAGHTFDSQAAWWLAELGAGRIVNKKTRKPVRPRTIEGYLHAVNYLNSVVGRQPLAALNNPEARRLVARMKCEQVDGKQRFSTKTISEYFHVFTYVIASAKDENAKQIFSRDWDLAYIGLPMVNKREQHRPTLEKEEIETILSKVKRPIYQVVAALLAGGGPRIREMLALELGKHISPDCTLIKVRQQRSKKGNHIEPYAKTDAGIRDIDLAPELTALLKNYIGERASGFLFETERGKMLSPENLWRDGFRKIVRDMGLSANFTSFRRFRESVLQASECRALLIDYWMGHSNSDMASRYGKQLVENKKFRAEWAAKVGLGFDIPATTGPGLLGIRGIQNQQDAAAA